MNCTARAYDYLENIHPGSYHAIIRYTLEQGGIIHAAPDCFCLAVPDDTDPRTVTILFQCSHLPSLWRLARMYRHQFTHVTFRRDFKNKYKQRRIPIARFLKKTSLASFLTKTPPGDSPASIPNCTL